MAGGRRPPRQRGALGVLALGTVLGTTTGGALGALTISALALGNGGGPDDVTGGSSSLDTLALLGALAFGYGAVVGLVVSFVASLVLAVARVAIAGDPRRGRAVAAVAAALPVVVVGAAHDVPLVWVTAFALVCACGAALWSRLILGLPRHRGRFGAATVHGAR